MSVACVVCSKQGAKDLSACSACKGVFYCSKDHQKEHWPAHKEVCKRVKEAWTKNLVKVTVKPGDGNAPSKGQTVKVNYVGRFVDGKVFDQSSDAFSFVLGAGQVIKGWDEGLAQMSIGEKATLFISPEYGYGPRGYPPVIPPNAPLVFDVELLSFE